MRFTVVTYGSEGDTRPLAALCRGLLDRGHEVKLFADQSTLSLPRALGIPCDALQGDVKSMLPIGDPRQKLRMADVMRIPGALKALVRDNCASWLCAVGEHADKSDAVLFSSLALNVGLILRDELQKTAIALLFQPITPTREFSSPALPPMALPGWLNLWTYKIQRRQMVSLFARSACDARREVFGTTTAVPLFFDFPVLYCISKELVPQPRDWPAGQIICGHWRHPMEDWRPPSDLLEFMGSERPIYIGFGSASSFVRTPALQTFVEAVDGRKVVFSPGWSNIDNSVLPSNFFIARDVPHEWLFPRMSVGIHHGGAGTTHTAARAGLPQLILPFGGDQPFWANRVAKRGAAPKASRPSARKPSALAKLIEFAELDSTQQRATELGNAMSREDGVQMAVREIEGLVERDRKRRLV